MWKMKANDIIRNSHFKWYNMSLKGLRKDFKLTNIN